MLRNKRISKTVKIAVIAVSWIFYFIIAMAGCSGNTEETAEVPVPTADETVEVTAEQEEPQEEEETPEVEEPSESPASEIESLSFTETNEIALKVGETASPGSLKISFSGDITSEDVVFVSENPEIAEISLSEWDESDHTKMSVQITGIAGGETNVYATTEDGSVKSERIHVVVSEPVVVESIELQGYESELAPGQTTKATATVEPADAENQALTWVSSDEAVASVDGEGNVAAVGGGVATITAKSANGVEASFDVTVNEAKAVMNLKVDNTRTDNVNIGKEWTYVIQINGEPTSKTMEVEVGETLSFYAEFTEDDQKPDVGTASASHTVTAEDIQNGFEVTMNLNVTENGGRYRGKTAQFVITFTFTPGS
jgi:hypothetical protein